MKSRKVLESTSRKTYHSSNEIYGNVRKKQVEKLTNFPKEI
jgi:hypothetical protein